MRKSAVLAAVVLAASSLDASAGLFTPGSTFTVDASSSPDTFDETATLTNGIVQSLDGGALNLVVSIVPAGGGDQWLVFDYNTSSGSPLSQGSDDWSVYEVGLQAYNPVTFIAAYLQFSINGVAQTPTGNIFGGYSIASSPVPGFTGTGWAASGFSAIFDSPLPTLGSYISPWAYLGATGVNYAGVNGYEEALEFSPTTAATPEASTWAMMLLGFAGLSFAGWRASRRGVAVAA
jgi:hypothetical protein